MKRVRPIPTILTALLGLALLVLPAQSGASAKQTKLMTGPNREHIRVTTEQQIVYGLSLFDGGVYQTTFCPAAIGTVYMIAGADNVVTCRRTAVYFWPLTKNIWPTGCG